LFKLDNLWKKFQHREKTAKESIHTENMSLSERRCELGQRYSFSGPFLEINIVSLINRVVKIDNFITIMRLKGAFKVLWTDMSSKTITKDCILITKCYIQRAKLFPVEREKKGLEKSLPINKAFFGNSNARKTRRKRSVEYWSCPTQKT